MSRPGDIGPLMRALMAYLGEGRGSPRQIASVIGHPESNVQAAIERLRARKSPLVGNVIDSRKICGRKRPPRVNDDELRAEQQRGIVGAAIARRSALEECWR